MGLLDPSENDLDPSKKPRFRQDLAVVFIVFGGVFIYLILEWFL